jgi:hypothetical protein
VHPVRNSTSYMICSNRRAICALVKLAIATAIIIGHGVQHLEISARNARLYFIMPAARPQIRKFDPSDAIAVITGHRKERVLMERELTLLAFITWMLFPNRLAFVSSAQIIGAANYYLNLSPAQRRKTVRDNPHFSQDAFAKALLRSPLGDTFTIEFELACYETVNISEIIEFFMICPAELRPSLLKALHFIEQGGFIADDVDKSERDQLVRSAATLKKTWVKHVVAGPFIWAADSSEFEGLLSLAPDQTKTIAAVKKFLAHRRDILNFFGLARFCQERLISRLDERSRSRFRFVKFPPNVVPIESELPELDAVQMAVLKRYRAPKLID